MIRSKCWKVKKMFDGIPKDDDLELVDEILPDPKDGEMLIEALYLSVDPYMRIVLTESHIGGTMIGEQISRVIDSRDEHYPVGTIVRNFAGWRHKTIIKHENTRRMPDLGDFPLSTALGVMGMPGLTAYFGFLEICKPKKGEVVVINGAAGAIGSLVGQIAKIKGCKVIGFAGDDEKCKWMKDLGFDFAYNYKKVILDDVLKKSAPDGIDCFFDNVGGDFSVTVLQHMNSLGRVSICGIISLYNTNKVHSRPNEQPKDLYPIPSTVMDSKQLIISTYDVNKKWSDEQWKEGEKQIAEWIREVNEK
ncbi:prostaglandin reductase 1 [Mytilus galloprovincialis]|uniref:15-oxoprostaglandin 13-reductase n=1 Tax=Mytilus galloprovincialis TaxID=29158 RepID=A0A8B6D3E9_MYTGA|nr:prostaglandin reductase 1 [Mytilus galloprovincialis]